MDRLLILRLESRGCAAEAWFNGIPLLRVDAGRPVRSVPIHEFAIAGMNELTLVIEPAIPSQIEQSQAVLSDGTIFAGIRLLLPRMGSYVHPDESRSVAQCDWHPPDGEVFETPLTIAHKFELPIAFPRWRWLDAPRIEINAALREQAAKFLQRLTVDWARANTDAILEITRLRFEELAVAYQRDPAAMTAKWRTDLQARCTAGPMVPTLTTAKNLVLRAIAGERLLECLQPDGLPAVRASGQNIIHYWPIRLAVIDGKPHVLR